MTIVEQFEERHQILTNDVYNAIQAEMEGIDGLTLELEVYHNGDPYESIEREGPFLWLKGKNFISQYQTDINDLYLNDLIYLLSVIQQSKP